MINWKALDKIVKNYTAAPAAGWLLPPLENCSLPEFVAARPTLNLHGLAHEQYRPLFWCAAAAHATAGPALGER